MIYRFLTDRLTGKVSWGQVRSPKWPAVRRTHLTAHPLCAACGGDTKLEVHHMIPFHVDPSLELDPKNLITLCESKRGGLNCHLAIGHLGDYRSRFNPWVVEDAPCWARRLKI